MMAGSASEDPARIAVVLLNYRTPELVLDCLASLEGEVDPERDVVVVVDNASGDGSADRIRQGIEERRLCGVRLVESPTNGGFAAGNNAGIRHVKAQAYLLLNSDTIVRPGAVETLWRSLCEDPTRGIVGPRLEWPDGLAQISCFRDHTPWSELIRGSATGAIRALLDRRDVPLGVRDEAFAPEWLSFAAALVRGEVVDRVGPLDEDYFMYFEDADYCRRVREAGFVVWHEPAAAVVHLRGGSSPVKELSRARKRRPRYYYASRSRYFRKAYGRGGWWAANLLWVIGRAVGFGRQLVGRRDHPAVQREFLDIWIAS